MEYASDQTLVDIPTLSEASYEPTVIGLYGISGSGKTFVMNDLRTYLKFCYSAKDFDFYEGSEMIAGLEPGGLGAFQALDEQQKTSWRAQAIEKIKDNALQNDTIAIVTGHLMFWPEGQTVGQPVYTPSDLDVFTHIIYLATPAEHIFQRRLNDRMRDGPLISVEHLRKWQEEEVIGLRRLCPQHGILLYVLTDPASMCSKAFAGVRFFCKAQFPMYSSRIERFDRFLSARNENDQLRTALVLDADRTLAPMDTSILFWQILSQVRPLNPSTCPLQELFGGPLGYTEKAFHQATLLYEEAADDDEFDDLCEDVASSVVMYPEILSLLRAAAKQKHILSVVITCGLARVWDKVLENNGLSSTVVVVGGGRISDNLVVLPTTKAEFVVQLQEAEDLITWVFGDSPLDMPMLEVADEAIVVVGEEQVRSSSMDAALTMTAGYGKFKPRQVLLPGHVSPRLNQTKLPLVRLDDPEFLESVLRNRFEVLHATEKCAAKLLVSPMCDVSITGPTLRAAHQRVGLYLANEFVSQLIGVEEHPIVHVQGHQSSGYRLRHEQQTSIVALMRGGEPMACGVSEAFPTAMFIHAASASDIKDHHLQNQRTVILVDSVVNSGKSMTEFVMRIRNSHPNIRIVVVAGAVQAELVAKYHDFHRRMWSFGISLVALRLSENKSTDTGNRLFNTTHLA